MKRSDRLLKAVRGVDRMVILTHNYPDPDAMASAWGLKTLIEAAVCTPCRVMAGGSVLRSENVKFVEMLRPPLELVDAYPPDAGGAVVFVDCQPAAGNHLLSGLATGAVAVIDHHPQEKRCFRSIFRDVRPRSASCSTIVADYLREQSIPPDTHLATALFMGAATDIARHPILTSADQRALRFLSQAVDFNLMLAIQNAPYPRGLYRRICDALQTTRLIGDTAVCFGDAAGSPAGMAGLADIVIRCEGLSAVLISAPIVNDFFITVRSRTPGRHAGELAQALTSGSGSGGGHAERAAGRIPITGERSVQDIQGELLNRWKRLFNLEHIPELPFLQP